MVKFIVVLVLGSIWYTVIKMIWIKQKKTVKIWNSSRHGWICITIVETSWTELPYPWFEGCSNNLCLENLEALLIW